MSTIFTFPGKCGDAVLQFPVAFWWAKQTGQKFEAWLDEGSCKMLVPLFEAQSCVESVKLIGGIEGYGCGGQPFHFNLSTKDFGGNTVYHLGLRKFPQRQISLQCLNDAKVPITVDPKEFAETPYLEVGEVERVNRLVLHGQSVCPHNKQTPTFWKFIWGIHKELEALFEEIVFVGSPDDQAVGKQAYPDWGTFDDGGDALALARLVAGSRLMIGCGSFPITMAGALKVPAIRVHDTIGEGGGAPRAIWDNLGDNQLNRTEIELRKDWPKFRDRWIKEVVEETVPGA